MMKKLTADPFKLALLVILALIAGGLLAGPAQAAANVVLGGNNTTNKQTTINNSAGIPLSLVSPVDVPSLKINHSYLIPLLNADRVDSLNSTDFARATMKTGVIISGAAHWEEELNAYTSTATCPTGTLRTGGGSYLTSGVDTTSIPDPDGRSWTSIGSLDAVSYVVCLSPTGAAIPGAGTQAQLMKLMSK